MTAFRAPRMFPASAWIVRVLVLVVLAASLALATWSWQNQHAVARQFEAATAKQTRLVTQVQQVEMRWDAAEAAKVDAAYQQIQGQLFTGPEEVANWQSEVQKQTKLNLFENNSKLGKPETKSSGDIKLSVVPATIDYKLSVLPATIDLEPTPGDRPSPKTPYHGLLAFSKALQELPKRIDIMELAVTGGSNSIAQARVVLHLWTQGGKP